jgi:hypothetical protein
MAAPTEESRQRLLAAAHWLNDAAEGRTPLVVAADAARRLIDRALDFEAGAA